MRNIRKVNNKDTIITSNLIDKKCYFANLTQGVNYSHR